ncbi:MAG: fused MFS/spermidine synthase [Thermoanaerobaculales bacterium]|nr:fused MFS/spermidine synthase [Thermoanaerobaculales bacterium]
MTGTTSSPPPTRHPKDIQSSERIDTDVDPTKKLSTALFLAVFASGAAGLIWELLWQHHATLSFGVSAEGAAVTLISIMAGFALGGIAAGRLARRGFLARPLKAYAFAEILIGLLALAAPTALAIVSRIDTAVFALSPSIALIVQLVLTITILLIPAAAMGATIPILATCTKSMNTSLATIYAINTGGAVLGVLLASFVTLPFFGVNQTALIAAGLNLSVAFWALRTHQIEAPATDDVVAHRPPAVWLGLAFVSGLVIFMLEVAWFRAARAAYQATTDSFSMILAGFLLPLALGGWLSPHIRNRWPRALPFLLTAGASLIFMATPAIDRLDLWTPWSFGLWVRPVRFAIILGLLALPVTAIGTIFPWLLHGQTRATGAGSLYAANALGAITGALAAGFVLLPSIGATRTGWMAAGILALMAGFMGKGRRVMIGSAAVLAAAFAVGFDAKIGRVRVQGSDTASWRKILFTDEGPDSTVTVIETEDGVRELVIDGFGASTEADTAHYMRYMGHLPALATPHRERALVICFGTGQTANAVRRQGFRSIDVVDVSEAVFRAGSLFPANESVLEDPAVQTHVMDGRAFLRRFTDRRYDLVTLEPMPPNFAGTNNLYSREFYELVRQRLREDGVVAQWVPLHLLSEQHMGAVIATFHEAFPYSALYRDPFDQTGIIVGSRRPWRPMPSRIPLDLDSATINSLFVLRFGGVRLLSEDYPHITDDNQLLAYGLDWIQKATGNLPTIINMHVIEHYGRLEDEILINDRALSQCFNVGSR